MHETGYYVLRFGKGSKSKTVAGYHKRRPTERPGLKILKGPFKSLKEAAMAADPAKIYGWIIRQCLEHGYIRADGKRKSLTRAEAAELTGMSRYHFNDVLKGKATPLRRHARLLAFELNEREQADSAVMRRFLILTRHSR